MQILTKQRNINKSRLTLAYDSVNTDTVSPRLSKLITSLFMSYFNRGSRIGLGYINVFVYVAASILEDVSVLSLGVHRV